jgi:hypothetical protein
MLKFNFKLGGNNYLINIARLSIINKDRTIVVGTNVTYPSPGLSRNVLSLTGIVASINR